MYVLLYIIHVAPTCWISLLLGKNKERKNFRHAEFRRKLKGPRSAHPNGSHVIPPSL